MPYQEHPLNYYLDQQEAYGTPVSTIERVRGFLNQFATEGGKVIGQDYSGFLHPKILGPGSR